MALAFKTDLLNAFRSFDETNCGYMEVGTLKNIMMTYGSLMDEELVLIYLVIILG